MSHVNSVLVDMLKAWPTLRGSRLDCLHDLATSSNYDARWNEDGSLWVSPEKTTNNYDRPYDEDSDADVVRYRQEIEQDTMRSLNSRVAKQMLATRMLHMRSDALTEAFNRDNAEEIIEAGNNFDNPFKDYPNSYGWDNTLPGQHFRLLDNIPENADPEWVAAFIELMEEVLRFKFPEEKFTGMATDYAQRYHNDLERAKQNAREVLIRLKGTDKEKIALNEQTVQHKLDRLIEEAARLGVTVSASIV